jgi:hypothetical protein
MYKPDTHTQLDVCGDMYIEPSRSTIYIIVTDMEGNIRIYRLPKDHGTDQ